MRTYPSWERANIAHKVVMQPHLRQPKLLFGPTDPPDVCEAAVDLFLRIGTLPPTKSAYQLKVRGLDRAKKWFDSQYPLEATHV